MINDNQTSGSKLGLFSIGGPRRSHWRWIFSWICVALTIVWYISPMFSALAMDDIIRWHSIKHGMLDWHSILFNIDGYKWRPVVNIVQFFQFHAFHGDMRLYEVCNIAIDSVLVVLVLKVLSRVTKNELLAFLLTLPVITSRFSFYNIYQAYGVMELLGEVFLITIIDLVIGYWTSTDVKSRNRIFYWMAVSFLLIVHTHERYLIIYPFLVLVIVFKNFREWKVRNWLELGLLSTIVILNLIIKIFLGVPLLEGTGGTNVIHTFSLARLLLQFGEIIVNVFGLNIGPAYLNGATFGGMPRMLQVVSVILGMISVLVILLDATISLFARINNKMNHKPTWFKLDNLMLVVLAIVLWGGICLVSSITIRVELRWIYSPYLLFIIAFGYLLVRFPINRLGVIWLIAIVFSAGSILNDTYYKANPFATYFMGFQRAADSLKAETIDKYGVKDVAYDVQWIQSARWAFPPKFFLEPYSSGPVPELHFFKGGSELNKLLEQQGGLRRIIVDYSNGTFVSHEKVALPKQKLVHLSFSCLPNEMRRDFASEIFAVRDGKPLKVNVSRYPVIQLGKTFTIEALIKRSKGAIVSNAAILSTHPGSGSNRGFVVMRSGALPSRFYFVYGTGTGYTPKAEFDLPSGRWTYLAITVDNGEIRVFG